MESGLLRKQSVLYFAVRWPFRPPRWRGGNEIYMLPANSFVLRTISIQSELLSMRGGCMKAILIW